MHERLISNSEVARALRDLSLFFEMDEVPFKARAFEKAAAVVTGLPRPVAEIFAEGGVEALDELPTVGKGIARRIAELLQTGQLAELEAAKARTPIDLRELTAIEGLGPKRARALWEALKISNVTELREAVEERRLRSLRGFGERSEHSILTALDVHEQSTGRKPLGAVVDLAHELEATLASMTGVVSAALAGSIRRRTETIGDIDLLVAAPKELAKDISRAFERLQQVDSVLTRGRSKTSVRLRMGLNADLRVVEPDAFGAALLYFSGSKAHNTALRRIAGRRGYKLNEYGLSRASRRLASVREADIYARLNMAWIPPELREDQGEIEAALRDELPRLIGPGDLRGDLHIHSSWTDGRASIEAIARAAHALGREYIAITDHTFDEGVVRGLDEERLRAQIHEIRRVDDKLPGLRVLAGAELNIRADGSLDISDELLAELDVVAAAVHSQLEMRRGEMTARIIRAIDNPHVHMLCHPSCRALNRRGPVDLDFDAVLEACRRTDTVLEINAQPDRLDLPDKLVRKAIEAGVGVVIGSDAHGVEELDLLERFGVGVARRGWAEIKDVLNCLPADALLARLSRPHLGSGLGPGRSGAHRRRAPGRAPGE